MKKWLIYSLLALAAIIIALFILLAVYTDRVVDPYVRSLLEHTRPMNHRIEYKRIRVNLWKSSIVLKDVRMYPDSSLTENDLRFEIKVKDIRLTGFRIREMLFHKKLIIDDFLVSKPEVLVMLPLDQKEVIEDVKKDETPKKEFAVAATDPPEKNHPFLRIIHAHEKWEGPCRFPGYQYPGE